MATANERFFDATLRHAIDVRRFTNAEVRSLVKILEIADAEMARRLRRNIGPRFTVARMKLLLDDIYIARNESFRELERRLRRDLGPFGKAEAAFEKQAAIKSIPFEVEFADVSARTLRAAMFDRPFAGRHMSEWFKSLRLADRRRVTDVLQIGLAEGEGVDQMVRRVVGTRAAKFTDGALATTRAHAQTIVRTTVNHVSNSAREALWAENPNTNMALRWTATLDGRTSAICRARDGQVAPSVSGAPLPEGSLPLNPSGARPPAHPSCRSIMVGILNGEALLGRRPFVADKRNPRKRTADFRKEARSTGRPVSEIRREWSDKHVGTTPAATTYQQWLRRQSASFQDEVLGVKKGQLFRQGGLTLDKFVDRTGREFTLDQLLAREPAAFAAIGG